MSELPKGWGEVAIGDVCSLNNGRAFKPSEWAEQGVPIVRIQNLNNVKAPFNYFNGEIGEKYYLKGGELLFAWSGTPGTSFGAHVWRGGEAVLNQHIFRVDFDSSYFDKRFFRYAINQTLEELIGIAHGGVGLRHVTKGNFEKTKIAIVPKLEQKRIADKLDTVLARVDACRERLNRVPLILKRFRQSVLAAATSGKLTEDWKLTGKFGYLEDGQSHGDAVDCKLGDVITDLRYGTSKKCDQEAKGIAVLRIPNILDNNLIDLTDLKYAEFDESEIKKLSLHENDLLVIRSNGSVELVGKCALVSKAEKGLMFAGYLIRIRANIEKVLPKFLMLSLASPRTRQIIEITSRSTSGVNNINSDELRDLPIWAPQIEEQTEIVRRVETLFAFADRLEARLASASAAADKLTPALLAKAFRGELVPQDPNDEPAAALLQRLAQAKASEAGKAGQVKKTRAKRGAALSPE